MSSISSVILNNKLKQESHLRGDILNLAANGFFGLSRSRNESMQYVFSRMASFVGYQNIPVFVTGEKGVGKKKLVQEFVDVESGYLSVSKVAVKFIDSSRYSEQEILALIKSVKTSDSIVCIEKVEKFSLELQIELYRLLVRMSRVFHEVSAASRFKLFISSEVSLTLEVAKGSFLDELHQELLKHSVRVPNIFQRPEDHLYLVQKILFNLDGSFHIPPPKLLDAVARDSSLRSFNDLYLYLKSIYERFPEVKNWKSLDFTSV